MPSIGHASMLQGAGSAAHLVDVQPLGDAGRVVGVVAGQLPQVLFWLELHAAHRALLLFLARLCCMPKAPHYVSCLVLRAQGLLERLTAAL